MKRLYGTGVALVTPFSENLSVDVPALRKLVNFNIANGVEYIVILGTTGEPVTLTRAERAVVVQTIISENAGRLPLVLGVGGNNTQAVIEELQSINAEDFDAILSVSPYYNKPTQEGIYQHFKAIAQETTLPVIVYNVPGRTGSNILPDTILRLAHDVKNIVAVKEASGDLVQIMEIIKKKPNDFLVISGDDITALPTVLAGGAGVISVLGQGLPAEVSELIRLGLQGQVKEAYRLHYALQEGMHLIFTEGNPAGIKAILEALDISSATVRLPLIEASTPLKEKLKNFIKPFVKIGVQ